MSTVSALLHCGDERRRGEVRKAALNGLDYLEVGDDRRTLTVHFLGKAPANIAKENLRITGGQRIRDIAIVDIDIHRHNDPERDDYMDVFVDRAGDFSPYRLCIVALDENGKPTGSPPEDFDRRYACLEFSFMAGCPTDVDCKQRSLCPPDLTTPPEIDYLAKDYTSFRQLILDRLALVMPEWRERHAPDIGIALVELLAYTGDHLSYYQDAVATEAYIDTARERISVRRHLRLVDYRLHEGCSARAWVVVQIAGADSYRLARGEFYFITTPAGLIGRTFRHEELPAGVPLLVYEPIPTPAADDTGHLVLREARNEIRFYTWGDTECCLPEGATSAVVQGSADTLALRQCDLLIIEEVRGAETGNPADADPTHRHAVRLTKATPDIDPLTNVAIWHVEWGPEDALPFPVCISAVGLGSECALITDVSVVRGNVVLVEQGASVAEDLPQVPVTTLLPSCCDDCTPREIRHERGLYSPVLKRPHVAFAEPVPPCRVPDPCRGERITSALALLPQDVHGALPEITLRSLPSEWSPTLTAEEKSLAARWEPRLDLLDSGPDDRHFVIEVDEERRSHIRFGDGDCGRAPDPGAWFRADFRVATGLEGNVGADSINGIVFRTSYPSGIELAARNPMPAVGGAAPESVREAKLLAPHVFRTRLDRAVTPADYATIVMRDFVTSVQRAAATIRWTGSVVEVMVAVDPLARAAGDESLLCAIEHHLARFRRIGHDVRVAWARLVSLDIALTVCARRGYLNGHVKAAVRDALSNRALPGGKRGFFHPDSLTFGEGIHLSRLIAAVQAVPGVESVRLDRLERSYEGPNGEIEDGLLPLGKLEVARLDNDPSFPEHGTLSINVGGGR
jgi:hypothetical protein